MGRSRLSFSGLLPQHDEPKPDAIVAYHHRDGVGREMTWSLREVGNEGLGRDLALYLGPMMNELFAGLAVPSVEQYRQSWLQLGKHLTSSGRFEGGLRAVTSADIDACDVKGQYSRFRCLIHGLRAIDEASPDLLRADLKLRINFGSRYRGGALKPREPLTPFVAGELKDAADRKVAAARDRIVAGRQEIRDLLAKSNRTRFEDAFAKVADGVRPTRAEFDMFRHRKVPIPRASDLLVMTLPDAVYFIIAVALRVEIPIECLRTLRRGCMKNPARGYVSIEYVKGRGGIRPKIKRERVRDGGINTPGGLIRLALELSEPSAERMRARNDPDADYLWVGFVERGEPSWRRFRLCTNNFKRAIGNLDLVDDEGRRIDMIAPSRLRKTVKRDNYLRHAGHLRRFASDNSRPVAARHYAAVDGLREQHARSVAVAETQLFEMAMVPLVLPPAEEAGALVSGLSIGDRELDASAVASLVSGEADTFLGICSGFWSSPMRRNGDNSCAIAFTGCLHCPNAVFTARKLPALLTYLAWLDERRDLMTEAEWHERHGAEHDRIAVQIIPMFDASEIDQARAVVGSTVAAPILPPHLLRS